MTDHMQAIIEAGAKAWWEARTTFNPENDIWDNADRFPEEKEYALKNAQLNIEAALPHIREMIAQEIESLPTVPYSFPGGQVTHMVQRITAARVARGERS